MPPHPLALRQFASVPAGLDRGTFLPLDASSSPEIEAIADEVLGHTCRKLLDELRADQMRTIDLSLAESGRALDANADRIRTAQRTIQDLTEQIEEFGDVRARLSAVAPSDREPSADFVRLSRQQQLNQREITKLDTLIEILKRYVKLWTNYEKGAQVALKAASLRSSPQMATCSAAMILTRKVETFEQHMSAMGGQISQAQDIVGRARQSIAPGPIRIMQASWRGLRPSIKRPASRLECAQRLNSKLPNCKDWRNSA